MHSRLATQLFPARPGGTDLSAVSAAWGLRQEAHQFSVSLRILGAVSFKRGRAGDGGNSVYTGPASVCSTIWTHAHLPPSLQPPLLTSKDTIRVLRSASKESLVS